MGKIGLHLELWPAEYESAFQIDEFEPDSEGHVEIHVEGIGWKAVEPPARARPEPIHSAHGVRCVEARIILDDESSPIIEELSETSRLVEVTILRRDNIYCSAGKWPVS
jgi:hypothetical protein